MLGRWDEAVGCVDQIGAEAETGAAVLATELTAIVPVYLDRGEYERADRFVDLLAQEEGEADPAALSLTARARALRARGDYGEAFAVLTRWPTRHRRAEREDRGLSRRARERACAR